MIEAAEEAAVWFRLLSWSVHSGEPRRNRVQGLQKAKASNSAVIDMLNDHPILRPE